MSTALRSRRHGFTLVELLVGLALSLIVMAAVLSSYVFLARNFTRSLGVVYAVRNTTTQSKLPPLEAQLRLTLGYFSQDVRMASGIASTPAPNSGRLALIIPTANGTTTVTYEYDAVARTLTRTWPGLSGQVIHHGLLGCSFNYFDLSGHPYTAYTDYMLGVKQLSLAFTAQGGEAANRTLTQVYRGESPRILLRNRSLPP